MARWPQLILLVVFALAIFATNANAQISIQIGGSEADYKAALAKDGYDRIDTVKLGLSSSVFDACKNNRRYRVKFQWNGDRDTKVIGECRTTVDEARVRALLIAKGYDRVSIEDRAGKFLAVACLATVRYRVELNYYGDVLNEQRIGGCTRELSPTDISAKLESDGYDRITFLSRTPPLYLVQACKDGSLLEMKIDAFAIIRESKFIGRCRGGIDPSEVVKLLEDRGFTQVTLIDSRLPRYIAEACRLDNRVQVTLNRWGDISDEIRIGKCRTTFTLEEVKASMRDNGFTNISVVARADQYIAKGCTDSRYHEIILSQFGELVSRRDLGSCDSPKINDLAELLRQRGMDELKFFVEGCERGSKIRLTFDEFANRTNREVIGGC
jgi:hypothetical protein